MFKAFLICSEFNLNRVVLWVFAPSWVAGWLGCVFANNSFLYYPITDFSYISVEDFAKLFTVISFQAENSGIRAKKIPK